MAKEKNTTESSEETTAQTAENQTTVTVAEKLQAEGQATLTAKSREDLFDYVEAIKTTLAKGQTLVTGAVGRSRDDGTYMTQIRII